MRTKALLGAAILAAGLATSMAQSVYSLNVVGYYNVTVGTGATPDAGSRFKLICMQLKPDNNNSPTLANALTNVPAGTLAYVWSGTGWNPPSEYLGPADGWEQDYPLPYGTGVMLKNTAASPITITFVGEVMEGNKTNSWGTGYSPRGPFVPQAGGITTVHNFSQVGDKVLTFNGGWSPPNEYFGGTDGWESGEPILAVGDAVMVSSLTGGQWVRNFTVPQTP
jgi:hypothetical protein